MNHHDELIARATKDGWIRGHAWRAALHHIGSERGYDELKVLEEDLTSDLPRPDAWRIVIEGPETPNQFWNYEVVVLEFLEVEVTSGITQAKDEWYRFLWDIFDATHFFHLRIWHMDRFGVMRPYITNSPTMVFGMNAGWRS